MEHQSDFRSASKLDSREVAQISGLISDLERIVRIIDLDIAAQEQDARVFDPSRAAYPIAARMLRVRRDNLANTIASLEGRLAAFEPCNALSGGTPVSRRRSWMLSFVAAGCWIVLFAFVLNSVFAANKLHKQIRSKDRQSTQGG
jgi:hypothetical protein